MSMERPEFLRDIPIPPISKARKSDLDWMAEWPLNACVDVDQKQANRIMAKAKTMGIKLTQRKLDQQLSWKDSPARIWRIA